MKHPRDLGERRRALALRKVAVRRVLAREWASREPGPAYVGRAAKTPTKTFGLRGMWRANEPDALAAEHAYSDARRAPVEDETFHDLATVPAEIAEIAAEAGP